MWTRITDGAVTNNKGTLYSIDRVTIGTASCNVHYILNVLMEPKLARFSGCDIPDISVVLLCIYVYSLLNLTDYSSWSQAL